MEKLQRHDSMLLKALETILASGFLSRRRAIVNATVIFWNKTFGASESLEYPKSVEIAIRRLRSFVDIQLVSFPDGDTDMVSFRAMEDYGQMLTLLA